MQALTVRCKLIVPTNFRQEIDETLASFADACNQILAVAKRDNCWNTTKLHHQVYKPTREATKLKANHVCQAIRRVINQKKATKTNSQGLDLQVLAWTPERLNTLRTSNR